MKERPILYSTPMVIAKMEGRKTQTRRAISKKHIINDDPDRYKSHACITDSGVSYILFEDKRPEITPWISPIVCPYGTIGDILWAREAWRKSYNAEASEAAGIGPMVGPYFEYRADHPNSKGWKPSIHMFKQAARIWEEITNIRIERLQDISPGDACDEGIEYDNVDIEALNGGELVADFRNYTWRNDPDYEDYYFPSYASCVDSYRSLWESINGPGSWDINPWVWVITTKILSTTGRPADL